LAGYFINLRNISGNGMALKLMFKVSTRIRLRLGRERVLFKLWKLIRREIRREKMDDLELNGFSFENLKNLNLFYPLILKVDRSVKIKEFKFEMIMSLTVFYLNF
jgi:hypothetical protein